MGWEEDLVKALEDEIKKDSTEGLYNEQFYADHEKYRPIYDFIGEIIKVGFEPKSVIDFGCGAGYLLEKLKALGVSDLYGMDGGEGAESSWPDHMKNFLHTKDILQHKPDKRYDVAICMEVAEHLNENKGSKLVKLITKSCGKFVWWTAAQPGQGGTGHVNCQSICYWVREFEACGFVPMWEFIYQAKMEMLKLQNLILGFPWFRDNFVAFKRVR